MTVQVSATASLDDLKDKNAFHSFEEKKFQKHNYCIAMYGRCHQFCSVRILVDKDSMGQAAN